MKTSYSIRNLFLFLLFFFPLYWFTTLFPYNQANNFFTKLPTIVKSSIVNQYPDDLVININNGQLSLNRETPYCLSIKETNGFGIVFDTVSDPIVKAFNSDSPYASLCQPMMVIGKYYFMSLDPDKNEIKLNKIPTYANFIIDKKTVIDFTSKYFPQIISFGKYAYIFLPFIAILPVIFYFLLNNIWYSFITRMMFKLFKVSQNTDHSEIFGATLCFYSIITAFQWLVVGYFINNLLGQNIIISFPFMNTILIVIFSVIYFKNKPIVEPPITSELNTTPIQTNTTNVPPQTSSSTPTGQ